MKVEIYNFGTIGNLGTVPRDGFYTKSISERLWFAPTVWFFADHINVNVGSLALKKSPFVCCFTTACNTFTHRRQTASQNILLQKTPLPSDLNFDVCSQKSGSDPENLQNLAKVRDREIFARSAIFSKLFTIPSCLPYQLFSSVVEQPCANFISLLLFCAEVISCSKIFLFLFRMNTVLDCSWCQPYRRYFFCIYMCISLFLWKVYLVVLGISHTACISSASCESGQQMQGPNSLTHGWLLDPAEKSFCSLCFCICICIYK